MTKIEQPDGSSTTASNTDQTLYRLIFEQSSLGMACVTLEGVIYEANKPFCALIGYTRDEVSKMSMLEITYKEDMDLCDAFVQQLLMQKSPAYTFEQRYVHKDGKLIWVRVTATLLQHELEMQTLCFLLIEDISFYKKSQEERVQLLKREEVSKAASERAREQSAEVARQLKAVISAITEPIVFFDVEGKILQTNVAARQLFSWTSEQMYEGRYLKDFAETTRFFDENGQDFVKEQVPMNRILRGEVISQAHAVDLLIRSRRDKRTIEVSISGAPVRSPDGEVLGGVCVFRDVTTQRQKMRQIQQSLTSLLTLVEALIHVPELSESYTDEGGSLAEHKIADVGQRLADLMKDILNCEYVVLGLVQPETERIHLVGISGYNEDERNRAVARLNSSFMGDYIEEDTIRRLKSDQMVIRDLKAHPYLKETTVSSRYALLTPMFVGEQMVGACVTGMQDNPELHSSEGMAVVKAVGKLVGLIIEQVRLVSDGAHTRDREIALQETNSRFDSFMSIASHELRTPLTTIKGNIQLAMRRLETTLNNQHEEMSDLVREKLARVKSPLEYAVHRVGVQDRMISDLLDASRIRANKFAMVIQPADLVSIVRNTTEDVQLAAPERQILLKLPAESSLQMEIDADRIGQVVANYLNNALKYSPPEQPVEIRLEAEGKYAHISVSDHGPGLAPADQEHVWDRFFRAEGVEILYGSGAGLGLGLYLCRIIVEQHSGQIGLESVQGQGSTFWFTLPLICTQDEA